MVVCHKVVGAAEGVHGLIFEGGELELYFVGGHKFKIIITARGPLSI